MSDPTSPTPSNAPPRPARGVKIPAGVVTVLVLALLAGGAWFVWDQMFATHTVDPNQYESNDSPSAMARSRFLDQPTTNPTAAITRRNDGTGEVRQAGAVCRFTKNGASFNATLAYLDQRFLPIEDRLANVGRFQAMVNQAGSAAAGVTADQLAKLKELVPPQNIPVMDADRQNLIALWTKYGAAADADKDAVAASLDAELRRLAAAGIDPATRAYNDYANKIRAILTPEQIAALRQARRNRPLPATAPAR